MLSDAHQQVLEDMIRIFEAQRLVSLSTILDLADDLESVAHGKKLNVALASKLASRISDIQLPRNSLNLSSENEREAYGLLGRRGMSRWSGSSTSGAAIDKAGE